MSRTIIIIFLLISAVAYWAGVTSPIVTIEQQKLFKLEVTQYTVFSSIGALVQDREFGLAAIITLFTVVFPITKYFILFVGVITGGNSRSSSAVRFIEKVGKWSMLDVFVVALLIAMVKFNSLLGSAKMHSEPGLFVYAFSVISAMILAAKISSLPANIITDVEVSESCVLRPCGFWIRAWASIIDAAISIALILPLMIHFYGPGYLDSDKLIEGPADFIFNWLLPIFVTVGFWHKWGATPGKMMIGAKIVDAKTGLPVPLARLFGRYFGYFLSAIPVGLGIVAVGIDSKRQGWHDKAARTMVVYKN